MKWLGRILVAVLILGGVFYFIRPPEITQTTARTQVERQIENDEDQMTRQQRIERLFNFQEKVETALRKRVPASDYVASQNISKNLRVAIVATEDKRFYEHGPIDMFGIMRAFYTNTVAGETLEGGSTITQQLVKTLFLSAKRIISRKIEEALLASMMEHYYSKDEILAMYLNTVYYGHEFYGIKAASYGYFGVDPKELTLAQAAFLAGMPQAPNYYDPYVNMKGAKNRQATVLTLMMDQGFITKAQAEEAMKAPLNLR